LWVRRKEPDIFRKIFKVLHAKDFLRYRLTGKMATDYSDASSMNLWDINQKKWSSTILEGLELPAEILPEPRPSTEIAGEIHSKMASEVGLPPRVPIAMGGGDGPCAAVGAGVISEGDAYNYIGSSSWIALANPKPVYDPARRTVNFYHLHPEMVTPTGTMQSAGASYQWLRNNLCEKEMIEAVRLKVSPYELMNREAEKSPAGAKGLLFLPYLMGERSPHWNSAARGVFLGLTLSHNRADMIRSVLEGVSFNLRIILDAFIAQGIKIPSIRVIGGGARGALWRQILADILQRPVERLAFLEEATSLGAAIAGGIAFRIFKDFQVAKKITKVAEIHHPREEVREIYDRIYKIFQEAYESLVPIYTQLQGRYCQKFYEN
jgi:xylulokinase